MRLGMSKRWVHTHHAAPWPPLGSRSKNWFLRREREMWSKAPPHLSQDSRIVLSTRTGVLNYIKIVRTLQHQHWNDSPDVQDPRAERSRPRWALHRAAVLSRVPRLPRQWSPCSGSGKQPPLWRFGSRPSDSGPKHFGPPVTRTFFEMN